jgi:hypothetical protein
MDGVLGLVARAGEAAERARALASALHEMADGVRVVAARVRATESTPWRSLAADAFREGTSSLAASLGRSADDLDGASRVLRAHAATAADRCELLAGLAGTVERLLMEGLVDLARLAQESLEGALPRSWRLS